MARPWCLGSTITPPETQTTSVYSSHICREKKTLALRMTTSEGALEASAHTQDDMKSNWMLFASPVCVEAALKHMHSVAGRICGAASHTNP